MAEKEPKDWMNEALAEAETAYKLGEVPVGAVVVYEDRIIARAHNEVEVGTDATLHAEILALRRASAALGKWRLTGASLYVTLEPCPMCIGAILLSRVSKLFFGCYDPRLGAVGSLFDLSQNPALSHKLEVFPELCPEPSSLLLRNFFVGSRVGRD